MTGAPEPADRALAALDDRTIATAVLHTARLRPQRVVLVTETETLTAGQLAQRVRRLGAALRTRGIGPGAGVALSAPNALVWAVGALAVADAGGVLLPLHTDAVEEELAGTLTEADARMLLSGHTTELPALRRAARRAGCQMLTISGDAELSDAELSDAELSDAELSDAEVSAAPDALPTAHGPPPLWEDVAGHGADPVAAVFYTSGTTGTARGVVHTHRSLLATVRSAVLGMLDPPALAAVSGDLAALLDVTAARPPSFMAFPFASMAGFHLLLGAATLSRPLVTMARFSPRRALQLVERARPSVLVLGPAQLRLLLGLHGLDRHDLSCVTTVALSGDMASPDLVEAAAERLGCRVISGFGMTELGGAAITPDPAAPPGAVGRPLPGVEAKVLRPDGTEAADGEVGELLVRTPGAAVAYRQGGRLLPVAGEDGWVATGDLAERDPAGHLRIVGRVKNVIVRAGRNIHPEEVETVLLAHPGVAAALVRARSAPEEAGAQPAGSVPRATPGGQLGRQRVQALVVPAAAAPDDLSGRLLAHCRRHLSAHKAPDEVLLVEALPRTSTGKVRRHPGADWQDPAARDGGAGR